MSPIARALVRTRVQAARPTLFRKLGTETMGTKSAQRPKPDWGYPVKIVGGIALMYGPVVAIVMFWPYTVKPVMDRVRW